MSQLVVFLYRSSEADYSLRTAIAPAATGSSATANSSGVVNEQLGA